MTKDYYNIDEDKLIFNLKNAEIIPNLIFIAISSIYIFLYSKIPFRYNGITWTIKFSLITIFLMVIHQLVICPLTTSVLLKEIKELLYKDQSNIITPQERTYFIKTLMRKPLQYSLHSSYSAFLFMGVYFLVSILYLKCDFLQTIFTLASCIFAQGITAVTTYIFVENICSKKVNELINKEIDKDIINRDKFYGLKLYLRIFFHIIMPFLFSTIIIVFFICKEILRAAPKISIITDVMFLSVFNFIICFLISFFFYLHIVTSNNNCVNALEKLTTKKLDGVISLPVDLSYELEYNIFQIKEIINFWQNLAADTNNASKNILSQTSTLVSISNENASTSSIENEKVKDNSDYITKITKSARDITSKINAVHLSAEKTQSSIYEAIILLQEEIKKMTTITNANLMTITGIRDLNSKIESVQYLINRIEKFAEKDKMIAFNAELKINTAEEEGQNFHIIAYSLRRLVATIKSSTKEIKESLKSIQEATDNLIITSEGGTQKIRDGSNFYAGMEENFKTMLTSSDITLESVNSIQEILNSQYTSFLQINTSLLQMSKGFEQFAENSQQIQNSSEKLIKNADELYKANSKVGAKK